MISQQYIASDSWSVDLFFQLQNIYKKSARHKNYSAKMDSKTNWIFEVSDITKEYPDFYS